MATDAREHYEQIVEELKATAPVASGAMFGMPCLKHNGKMFAGFYDGAMVFKLGEPERARALALPDARLFDPSGQGRPMKEWVVVPAGQAEQWLELARLALHYLDATF